MIRNVICLVVTSCFLGSCARETNRPFEFSGVDSVQIDESQVVLTSFPGGLKSVSDSMVAMINGGRTVSLYNIYTGRNLRNFSTQNIRFDSLIGETFGKHYKGKRQYKYDLITAGGLSEGNSQILGFDHAGDRFYIYVNALVETDYKNDPEQIAKLMADPKMKAVQEQLKNFDIVVQEYIEFLFVTDNEFRLLKIIPLYHPDELITGHYNWYFNRGFIVENGALYTPVLRDDLLLQGDTTFPDGTPCFSLAKLNLSEPGNTQLLLNIPKDPRNFSVMDFISSLSSFAHTKNGAMFSDGKEIFRTDSDQAVFKKNFLDRNEWISSFFQREDGMIILTTYHTFKKPGSGADISYAVDSTGEFYARAFDAKKSDLTGKADLPYSKSFTFATTDSEVISVKKEKEHYYFVTRHFHTN